MRKTLQDVAQYLKEIMVAETEDTYAVNPIYLDFVDEENIHQGVLAFRKFLIQIYDMLYIKGEIFDKSKKVAHEYENRTTLSVYYPFLHNVKTLLMNIGYDGRLNEQTIICGASIFNKRRSTNKNLECLRLLEECGFSIDGIDTDNRRQDLSDI